jgi:hypothetical protein
MLQSATNIHNGKLTYSNIKNARFNLNDARPYMECDTEKIGKITPKDFATYT